MDTKVLLVGGFHEVIELCELCGVEVVGIIDNTLGGEYCGCPVLGGDESANLLFRKFPDTRVIISPDLPVVREKLFRLYHAVGFRFASLVSPRALISPRATLGRGVVIQSGVNVSAGVQIGDFVKLNTHANIMHDVTVGEFTTVAPNAVLLGRVHIGTGCYIGASATVLPMKRVGSTATIGAGSVVTRDVQAGSTVVGNPARALVKAEG